MNIKVIIENDLGEQIFFAEKQLVSSAVDELYRFEQHVLPTIQLEEDEPE